MASWLESPPALIILLAGLLILAGLRFKRPDSVKNPADGQGKPDLSKALVHCRKNAGQVADAGFYKGPPSCWAVHLYEAEVAVCPYACLGYGDCLDVCPSGALSIAGHTAVVDEALCLGCGRCRARCPQKLIKAVPAAARVIIPCVTKAKMKAVAQVCQAGCLGCLHCLKACPARALSRNPSGPPTIDYDRCQAYGAACGLVCREKCPRGVMNPRNGQR